MSAAGKGHSVARLPLTIVVNDSGHRTEGMLVGVMASELDALEADARFIVEQVAAIRKALDNPDPVLGVIDALNVCDRIEERLADGR